MALRRSLDLSSAKNSNIFPSAGTIPVVDKIHFPFFLLSFNMLLDSFLPISSFLFLSCLFFSSLLFFTFPYFLLSYLLFFSFFFPSFLFLLSLILSPLFPLCFIFSFLLFSFLLFSSYLLLGAESLNSLELLYGEAVSRCDIDGIESEQTRLKLFQLKCQEKKEKIRADALGVQSMESGIQL